MTIKINIYLIPRACDNPHWGTRARNMDTYTTAAHTAPLALA